MYAIELLWYVLLRAIGFSFLILPIKIAYARRLFGLVPILLFWQRVLENSKDAEINVKIGNFGNLKVWV